ncbi:hypothetical protein [Blastococcus sp. CCUG 61487]|uniref:hypothetical protein n=1 Tax=Blastococcus sp. CCUG 61487 TaxID=1840703 RepID=UPI0010C0C93E|nr:hypothetical protein [Blastococcus sp. CCUG 61487]TKJ35171.1 hypothetical protein A6V29_14485 [Blastococcus sp. CCUG 61487]
MRRSLLPALAAIAVTVAACGSGEDADAAAPTPTPPAEGTPAASTGEAAPLLSDLEAQRNERGNVPRQLGELAGVRPGGAPGAAPQAAIRVEQIVVDPECESEEVPVNGRFVALEMSVLTTPDLDPRVPMSFTEERFSVLAPDGTSITTEDSNASDCLDPEVFVPNMRFPAGVEYRGWLVLDVPVGSGTVVYSPPGATGGWEWQF